MKHSVRVRVPATTANVGPGFDTLGIALELFNEVKLSLSRHKGVALSAKIIERQHRGAVKMIETAADAFFKKTEFASSGIKVSIDGQVPNARGLGSSVTVRMGVVAALNHLFGSPLKDQAILELVSELEGHPDNAAPALYGGLTVAGKIEGEILCYQKKLAKDLKFIAAIPDFEVETKKARALLPSRLPFLDAVHNVNRVSLIVAAFWNEDYRSLGEILEDRLHQPFRAALIPQLYPVLNAAKLAGAIGGWLSGSGSTVMALTLSNPKSVGEAMQKVFQSSGISCQIKILKAASKGLRVEEM